MRLLQSELTYWMVSGCCDHHSFTSPEWSASSSWRWNTMALNSTNWSVQTLESEVGNPQWRALVWFTLFNSDWVPSYCFTRQQATFLMPWQKFNHSQESWVRCHASMVGWAVAMPGEFLCISWWLQSCFTCEVCYSLHTLWLPFEG